MTIKIKIRRQKEMETLKKKVAVTKTLDGELMFLTHPYITIIAKKDKLLCFAKDGNYTDDAYAAMKRLMDYFVKVGIIKPETVQGGNIYASLEGTYGKPTEDRSVLQLVVYHVDEFLKKEQAEHYDEYYKDEYEEYLLDPPEEDATELGEVPQEEKKGTVPKNPIVTPLIYRL